MKINFSTFLVLFIIVAAIAPINRALSQTRNQEIGHPHVTNFSSKTYKAHAQNWAMVEDPQGKMYFANSIGILEYDGVNWRLIESAGASFARAMAIDDDHRIYIGGVGNFGYLETNNIGITEFHSLTEFIDESLLDFNEIWNVHLTEEGIYFFGSRTHLSIVKESR